MSKVLKVLTYNIHVGMASHNIRHYLLHSWHHLLPHPRRQKNLKKIAHVIEPFDLVALQELDVGSIRSHYVNQVDYLAKAAAFQYAEYQTTRTLGPFAQHSKALLSRFPIHEVKHYALPSRIPGRGVTTFCLGEQENPLFILNVHLSLSKKARNTQLAFIADLISNYQHVIVMGDFNMTPRELSVSPLARTHLQIEDEKQILTYPSWKPKKQIDYILLSTSLKQGASGVIPCFFSDHLPLYKEVILPDEFELPRESVKAKLSENYKTVKIRPFG